MGASGVIIAAPGEAEALQATGRKESILRKLADPYACPGVPASVYAEGFPDRSNHRVLNYEGIKVAYSIVPEGIVIDHVGDTGSYACRLTDPSAPSKAVQPRQKRWWDNIKPTHWMIAVASLAAAPRLLPFWWGDEFYSVGLLVAPWAFWAILRQKDRTPAPERWRYGAMAVMIFFVVAGWVFRDVMLSLWGVAAALALHTLEAGTYRKAWVPTALLAITVPPPGMDTILLWSQKSVAVLSEGALNMLGLPVVRDSFLLTGPSYSYAVEPLCTGLSGILASVLLVGMAASHLNTPRKYAMMAMAIAVGGTMLFNIERIVLLVAITEVRGPSLIQSAFHEGVGLALSLAAFAAAIPPLLQTVPKGKGKKATKKRS